MRAEPLLPFAGLERLLQYDCWARISAAGSDHEAQQALTMNLLVSAPGCHFWDA